MPHRREFPHLKESQLRSLATPSALEAGRRAWQSGCVGQTMLSLREPMLLGSVQDQTGRLCRVSVRHLAGDEFGPLCDCADTGFCAHVMAVLLAWAHDSHEFTQAVAAPPTEPQESELRQQWSACLRGSSLTQLRAIARRHELPLLAAEREAAAAQLLDMLADPEHAPHALAGLDDRERRVLQMAYLLSEGSAGISSAELQESLGWQSGSAAEDDLHKLRDAGLIVSHCTRGQAVELFAPAPGVVEPGSGLFDTPGIEGIGRFAGDLAALRVCASQSRLPELLLLSQHMRLSARPAPPEPAHAQNIAALRRWPYVASELLRLQIKPGWNHQAESTLTVPVPEPWMDDRSLVQMRALAPDDTLNDFVARLAASATGEGRLPATLPGVYAAWQALATWTELWPAQQRAGLRVRRSLTAAGLTYAGWLQQLARARRFITRLLSLLPAGAWFDFDALLAHVHEIRADFLHEFGNPDAPSWWLEPDSQSADGTEPAEWQTTDGAFVAEVFRGPLSWLGMVELALARDDDSEPRTSPPGSEAIRAFRLTPLGLALLRGEEPPATPSEEPLRLTEPLTAHVRLGRQDVAAYQLLERIARFERVQDGEAVYRFEIHSAQAAFALGYTGEEIVGALEQLAGTAAPEAMRDQWLAWWQSYSQTRWYEGLTLIELADDYILQELLAQTDLREHLLFTFGPRLVAVRPDSAEAFTRQLVKKGYTPRIE